MNRLQEAQLEEFLFGAERIALNAIRRPLLEVQEARCFYCGRALDGNAVVDHFLPWSRYPGNGIENLVVADRTCNTNKSDFLAAAEHVGKWASRASPHRGDPVADYLAEVAAQLNWEHNGSRTLSVARAIYLRLPDEVRLWLRPQQFVPVERQALVTALA